MKAYLEVPFEDKEVAKSFGAQWDWQEKRWYAPNGEKALIDRWKATAEDITILHGENPTFGGSDLYVDLIPRSCWFTNVRYCIEPKDWLRLRRFVNKRASQRCECCKRPKNLEAHERWEYYETIATQKLMRIVALCADCHEVTHMGLAKIRGRGEFALSHLMAVRNWDRQTADTHVNNAFALWEKRNKIVWDLDLSIITDSGVSLINRVDKLDRLVIAETTLKEKIESESEISPNSLSDQIAPSRLIGKVGNRTHDQTIASITLDSSNKTHLLGNLYKLCKKIINYFLTPFHKLFTH